MPARQPAHRFGHASGVAALPGGAYPNCNMADASADRIEQALARIEAAAAARAYASDRLARRHAKLRARIQEAVGSLDALMARETPADQD